MGYPIFLVCVRLGLVGCMAASSACAKPPLPTHPGPLIVFSCHLAGLGERCWWEACRDRSPSVQSAGPHWWVQASDGTFWSCGTDQPRACEIEVIVAQAHCKPRTTVNVSEIEPWRNGAR